MSQVQYESLTDEEQIELGSEFVALGVPLPEALRSILLRKGLLELVLNPQGDYDATESGDS